MKVALVVGCSQYDSPAIADLEFAGDDAHRFAEILEKRSGLLAANIHVLSSNETDSRRKPTRNNIISALTLYRHDNPPPETIEQFVLFFSGHGFHSSQDNREYLLPQDGVSTSLEDSSLSLETIMRFLSGWNSRVTLLFLDACRAITGAGKGNSRLEPIRTEATNYSGCATFWSCGPGERSFEAIGAQQGVFTLALSMGLSDDGRCSTVYELNEFLIRKVPLLSTLHSVPVQIPYTRIEPLELRNSVIVSESVRASWQGMAGLGNERRRKRVERAWEDRALPQELICGIDFGTSHSAVTLPDLAGNTHFVPSPDGPYLVPSVVAITEDEDLLVGWSAVEYSHVHPERTFFHIKRAFGTASHLHLSGRSYAPEVLAAAIMRSLARNLEEWIGRPIDWALVSAPANFTIQQCDLLRRAFDLAGINVFRIVSEPNAASITIDLDRIRREDGLALVVDLGGGTLDVSVVDPNEGVFEIMGTSGDTQLGGIDYDQALAKTIRDQLEQKLGRPLSILEQSQLNREAERAKVALGTREETSVLLRDLENGGNLFSVEYVINRDFFRNATKDLDSRVEQCIDDAIKRARVPEVTSWRGELEVIVIAGQGGRLFTVQEMLTRKFPGVAVHTKYQDNAVAFGLGRYSQVLIGVERQLLLLDAIPTSIAIRCRTPDHRQNSKFDCTISVVASENKELIEILPRDTTIPTRKSILVAIAGASMTLDLSLVELVGSGSSTRQNELGVVALPITHGSDQLGVEVDVDENRSILIFVRASTGAIIARIQLNNFIYVKDSAGLAYGPRTALEGTSDKERSVRTFKISKLATGDILVTYIPRADEVRPIRRRHFESIQALHERFSDSFRSGRSDQLLKSFHNSPIELSAILNEDELNELFR